MCLTELLIYAQESLGNTAEKIMSLRDLEWLSGVRHNTIWFIEAGRRKRTHRSTVIKLAQALGIEPTELIGRNRV